MFIIDYFTTLNIQQSNNFSLKYTMPMDHRSGNNEETFIDGKEILDVSSVSMTTRFIKVSDIEIPDEMFNTIKTGDPYVDKCFSEIDGLVPSQVTLLTGVPGGGKTTLSCFIGAAAVNYQLENLSLDPAVVRPAVFISREMSDFQLKLQARKIPNFDLLTIVPDRGNYKDWIRDIRRLDPKPCVVIVDSLQKIASETYTDSGMNRKQVELVEAFTKFAKDTFIPVILIGHVGKDGNYIGPGTLKHEVDSHLHIEMDKEFGDRFFQMEKNRFGDVRIRVPMRLGSTGLVFGDGTLEMQGDEDLGIKEIVSHFKVVSKDNLTLSPGLVRKVIPKVAQYLQDEYSEYLLDEKGRPRPDIRLTWKGAKFLCAPKSGVINLGPDAIRGLTDRMTSGYPEERPYMERVCYTREDFLMWIFLHEFCHLFPDSLDHTDEFFQIVYKVAIDNSFLFSARPPVGEDVKVK